LWHARPRKSWPWRLESSCLSGNFFVGQFIECRHQQPPSSSRVGQAQLGRRCLCYHHDCSADHRVSHRLSVSKPKRRLTWRGRASVFGSHFYLRISWKKLTAGTTKIFWGGPGDLRARRLWGLCREESMPERRERASLEPGSCPKLLEWCHSPSGLSGARGAHVNRPREAGLRPRSVAPDIDHKNTIGCDVARRIVYRGPVLRQN